MEENVFVFGINPDLSLGDSFSVEEWNESLSGEEFEAGLFINSNPSLGQAQIDVELGGWVCASNEQEALQIAYSVWDSL